jgi:hypothetical protein
VASEADKEGVEDGTSHIQLGALGASLEPASEQWEGVLRKKTPKMCVFFAFPLKICYFDDAGACNFTVFLPAYFTLTRNRSI